MNTTFFQKASDTTQNISWKDIFSDVKKKHRKDQRTALLTKGMGSHIPAPNRMLTDWQKPWLFARVLFVGLLLSLLIGLSCIIFPGYGMLLMLCLLPAFVVPLSVMIFYWEMNIPGNISIYEALLLTLLGGLLSLTVTGVVRTIFPGISEVAFLAGPFPEEVAKCLIVTLFLCRKKYNYGLQGILIGGAVGVGFSAMESAGYALQVFDTGIQGQMSVSIIIRSMINILITRGVLAIGGHVVWAALYGGALALIMGKGKMSIKCFTNSLFWLTFSAAFLLHTAWNFSSSYLIGKLPDSFVGILLRFETGFITQWIKYIVLIILAWLLLFYIMKKSIRQMVSVDKMYHNVSERVDRKKEAKEEYVMSKTQHKESEYQVKAVIQGVSGAMNKKAYPLTADKPLVFGRNPEKCNVVFPNGTKGVSNVHCKIKWINGKVWIKDLHSTYGTYIGNGKCLECGNYQELPDQEVFYLGGEENMFFMGLK